MAQFDNSSSNSSSPEFERVVANYVQARSQGQQPDRNEILANHPDLADSLRAFFRNHDDIKAKAAKDSTDKIGCSVPDTAEFSSHVPDSNASQSQSDCALTESSVSPELWDSAEQLPTRIGKYEVRKVLGKGGQATAFLAFDPDLKRHVVLKLFWGVVDSEYADQVLAEGQALARVKSPYVAQVLAAERFEGLPYLVVEYVSGQTASDALRDGQFDRHELLKFIEGVADGLAEVHACGLIHRDVKPSNIMIGDDGMPRLIDFGLAAPLASQSLQEVSGTPAYMSPEQARGESERVDARTDIFGLGAVMYEMLTGKPPYRAKIKEQVLELAQRGDIQPPIELDSELPSDINRLCVWALAREPQSRPHSASQFANASREYLDKAQSDAKSTSNWKTAIAIGTGLLILMACVGIVAYSVGDTNNDSSPNSQNSSSVTESARHPDGRVLRNDFPLSAKLIGSAEQQADVLFLNDGQRIWLTLESTQECYVGVWAVSNSNTVVQLFPNEAEANPKLVPASERTIPGPPDVPGQIGKKITASYSGEEEYLHIVASTQPIPNNEGQKFGPYVVIEKDKLDLSLRSLTLEDDSTTQDGQGLVAEQIIRFQVLPPEQTGTD